MIGKLKNIIFSCPATKTGLHHAAFLDILSKKSGSAGLLSLFSHFQATIFKRFYREEAVHDVDGIGIGLYLAREIITMQGGYITVESEVGKGSTFSIFLPQR